MRPRPVPTTRQRRSLAAAAISDRFRTVIRAGASRCSRRGTATARYSRACARTSAGFRGWAASRRARRRSPERAGGRVGDRGGRRKDLRRGQGPGRGSGRTGERRRHAQSSGHDGRSRRRALGPAFRAVHRTRREGARSTGAVARLPGASARHYEQTPARRVSSVRAGRRCDPRHVGASCTPKRPSSGPGRASGQRCSVRAWPRVLRTPRRPRGGEQGGEEQSSPGDAGWRRAAFFLPLFPFSPPFPLCGVVAGVARAVGASFLSWPVWVVVLRRVPSRLAPPLACPRPPPLSPRSPAPPPMAVAARPVAPCLLLTAE